MADLKISQLPSVTTLDTADVFPVVDAGLTKQVSVQNLNNSLPITTFVQGASALWGGGLFAAQFLFAGPYTPGTGAGQDNLINNSDNFPRWNTTAFNTSLANFELINSNTTLSRVHIKTSGYYYIAASPHYFDLYNNMRLTVKLFTSSTPTGGMSYVTQLASRWHVGTALPPGQTVDGSTVFLVPTPGYYTVALFPTANSPYPSESGSAPSRFTLIKLIAS
jgi:hypothetical protein